MSPIRLAILAGLFYIGWRLLRGMDSKNRSAPDKKGTDRAESESDSSVRDVLVEDPVCHSLVPRHQAVRLKQDGKMYYFCSERCCDEFTEKIQRRDA